MAKVKTAFFCTNCGAESPKWMGQCPSCKEWNSLIEEKIVKPTSREESRQNWRAAGDNKKGLAFGKGPAPIRLPDVKAGEVQRLEAP